MKKTNILWIILNLVFLLIFNVLFFMLGGFEHNMSVWVSYAFIHFSYLMLLITPKLISKGKSSAIFGFSLYTISSVYFLIEFIIGMIFILIAPENSKYISLVHLLITGLYLVMLISNMIANESTAVADEKRELQIDFIKNTSTRLKSIMGIVSDKNARKEIEKVFDVLYSSPVKVHPNLEEIEINILQNIYELEDAVSNENNVAIVQISKSLLSMVNDRNMRLKEQL